MIASLMLRGLAFSMRARRGGHFGDFQHSICQKNSSIFRGSPSILADHLADAVAWACSMSSRILLCPPKMMQNTHHPTRRHAHFYAQSWIEIAIGGIGS